MQASNCHVDSAYLVFVSHAVYFPTLLHIEKFTNLPNNITVIAHIHKALGLVPESPC